MRRFLLVFFLIFLFTSVFAGEFNWMVLPKESKINFTAIQNGAPVMGEFKNFSANINFDPIKLAASRVDVVIDINSVNSSYIEVTNTLKTADWFDAKKFPQATFKAEHFIKTGENTYQAQGVLTIRDKTAPVTLNFVLEDYSATMARAKGTTMFKRTTFGVGQGEWSKTDVVQDDVKIDFIIMAVKAH